MSYEAEKVQVPFFVPQTLEGCSYADAVLKMSFFIGTLLSPSTNVLCKLNNHGYFSVRPSSSINDTCIVWPPALQSRSNFFSFFPSARIH